MSSKIVLKNLQKSKWKLIIIMIASLLWIDAYKTLALVHGRKKFTVNIVISILFYLLFIEQESNRIRTWIRSACTQAYLYPNLFSNPLKIPLHFLGSWIEDPLKYNIKILKNKWTATRSHQNKPNIHFRKRN